MMAKLKVLDLFSGIGGFSLGLERTGGFETAAFCEYEDFPRRVLAKHWPDVLCFPDVRELKGSDIDGSVDVICGGYPCQPFSTAGKRQGKKDDRHLWPEFMRLVAELRPAWVIGENVAGHISMGLDDVLSDLENAGYACRSFIIPACAIGASHRRDRVWTVAHSELRDGEPSQSKRPRIWSKTSGRRADTDIVGTGDKQAPLAHANDEGSQRRAQTGNAQGKRARGNKQPERRSDDQGSSRSLESRMGRMADGFSCRLDEPRERVKTGVKDRAARLKALGNAVHPDIPMMIGAAILEAEKANA